MINNFKLFLNKHSRKILWLAIFFYCLIFSLVSVWKYNHYLYNALDLAIYNQTFYNTSFGHWFELSIHPPTYLGDHFEPLILPLSFIYSFWRDPKILLILQSLILALIAWPVYLITKNVFEKNPLNKFYGLVAALLILLNPLVQNINLFEYHTLSWAIFFLLFAFYFYQRKKFFAFLIIIILSLLVREDVALVVFMFGPIYLIDFYRQRKNLKLKKIDWLWFLTPVILSFFWFFLSLKAIAFFNPDSHYKFLQYYCWLGNSFSEIIFGIFRHPLKIFLHLISIGNLEMILGFLFPFLLLPLFFPRYLLLAIGVFCQIVLGAPGGSNIILETHYSALFLPALVISSVFGAKIFLEKKSNFAESSKNSKKNRFFIISYAKEFLKLMIRERGLLVMVVVVAIIFLNLAFGPLNGATSEYFSKNQKERKIIKDEVISKIPSGASLVASCDLLPNLSSRRDIYSLNYVFTGKKQMSEKPYILPRIIDWAAINFDDLLFFQLQYTKTYEFNENYQQGSANIKKMLEDKNLGLVEILDDVAIFARGRRDNFNLIKIEKADLGSAGIANLNNEINYLGASQPIIYNKTLGGQNIQFFKTTLYWQPLKKINRDYQLKFTIEDETGKIFYGKIYPLAYGLYPTSVWQLDEKIKTTYNFLLPDKVKTKKIKIWLSLVDLEGSIRGNAFRYIYKDYEKQNQIGEKILLTTLD